MFVFKATLLGREYFVAVQLLQETINNKISSDWQVRKQKLLFFIDKVLPVKKHLWTKMHNCEPNIETF